MARPKGSKTKPMVLATKEYAEEYIEKHRTYWKKSNVALSKMGAIDRNYLLGLLDVLERDLSPEVKEEAIHVTNKFRYTPRRIFDNTIAYFRHSFENGQPITLFGIATFNRIHKDNLWDMVRNGTIPEDFGFLRDFMNFVEMYNEYAMHKKQNPAGPIFTLKNFGWKDKLEIEATSKPGALTDEEREAAQKRIAAFSEDKLAGMSSSSP